MCTLACVLLSASQLGEGGSRAFRVLGFHTTKASFVILFCFKYLMTILSQVSAKFPFSAANSVQQQHIVGRLDEDRLLVFEVSPIPLLLRQVPPLIVSAICLF